MMSNLRNQGSKKSNGRIREVLGVILIIAAWINKTVYHKADSDVVFDSGGKVAIIILILIFFLIYYIQSKKMDKG